jgi:hypothetical protein
MAREIPPSAIDIYLKLAHFGMLSNPASWAKNPLSNLLMEGFSRAANVPDALLQKAFVPQEERTTTLSNWRKDTKLNDTVHEWWVRYAMPDIKRTGMDMSMSILMNQNRRTFKNDVVENIADFPFWVMERGDIGFLRRGYEDALGRYMSARGMETPDDNAHQYAKKRALEDTFRDLSYIAKTITDAKNGKAMMEEMRRQDKIALESTDPVARKVAAKRAKQLRGMIAGAKLTGQAVMPYTNTPINIARRAWEYSPLGLGNFATAIARGDATGATRALSKALVGSAASFGLGALLGAMDIVTGSAPEDEGEAKRWAVEGIKPYSLKVGDMYVSLDWAAPMIIPFMMGVSTAQEGNPVKGANVFFDMSFIRNINDLVKGYGSPTEKIANVALQGPQQLMPNLMSKLAATIDPIVRDTYDPETSVAITNRILNKIPGARETLIPKYDAWGREVEQAQVIEGTGALGRLINNVLIPWRYSRANTEPETREVSRLYKAAVDGNASNASSVLPDFSGTRSLTVGDEGKTTKFTADEYALWQKTAGRYAQQEISELMNSPEYNNAPDYSKDGSSKWDMVLDVYNDARERAEAEIAQKRGTTFTIEASFSVNGKTKKYSKSLSGSEYQSMMDDEQSVLDKEKSRIRSMRLNDAKTKEYIAKAERYAKAYAKWEALGRHGSKPTVTYRED